MRDLRWWGSRGGGRWCRPGSRLVVAIGLPLPGSRNDCRAFTESGVDRACRGTPTIADGGYQGTGLRCITPSASRRSAGPSTYPGPAQPPDGPNPCRWSAFRDPHPTTTTDRPRQTKTEISRAISSPQTLTRVWIAVCDFVAWPRVMPKDSLTSQKPAWFT